VEGKMKRLSIIVMASLIFIGSILSGCGGSKTEVSQSPQTTLGQELIDLDKAYKQGIITEKQYEKSKKDLLEKYE
jgi:hypothetical protein